jgi:hypothetical protein
MWPCNSISYIQDSYLLFCNLTHKIETTKGGRLLIASHLDESKHVANQQKLLGFAVSFASFKMLGQSHFAGPNLHALTFLHAKFAVQCTGGVALMMIKIQHTKLKTHGG